jgi:hypothetical protein
VYNCGTIAVAEGTIARVCHPSTISSVPKGMGLPSAPRVKVKMDIPTRLLQCSVEELSVSRGPPDHSLHENAEVEEEIAMGKAVLFGAEASEGLAGFAWQ